MDKATILWIAGTAIVVITTIAVFAGRVIYERRQERKREIGQKLTTHFEDIKREVINHISEMARSLAIRHERLVTSYSPIKESYDFEKQESFECFKLHFPELAKEWKQLNKQAVEYNEKLAKFFRFHHGDSAQNLANNSIKDLQQEFTDYARRLAHKVESIDKYEMGKEFKKLKKCPTCKKF